MPINKFLFSSNTLLVHGSPGGLGLTAQSGLCDPRDMGDLAPDWHRYTGGMCNYQIQFARNRHTLPITRGYMGAEEERLLG